MCQPNSVSMRAILNDKNGLVEFATFAPDENTEGYANHNDRARADRRCK